MIFPTAWRWSAPRERPSDIFNQYWVELACFQYRAEQRYERLHWSDCFPGCACHSMSLDDIVNLLPHYRDLQFPPSGYTRVVGGNSLWLLAQRAARPLLVNYVQNAHFTSYHYANFQQAQNMLLAQFGLLKHLSYFALPPLDFYLKHQHGCTHCEWLNLSDVTTTIHRWPTTRYDHAVKQVYTTFNLLYICKYRKCACLYFILFTHY